MSEYITTALQEEEIKTAQEKLAELIRSDFARIDRMKADEEVTDFSKLDTITIGVMPGDGIGPLIMTQALRVLNQLLAPEIASGKVKFKKDFRKNASHLLTSCFCRVTLCAEARIYASHERR